MPSYLHLVILAGQHIRSQQLGSLQNQPLSPWKGSPREHMVNSTESGGNRQLLSLQFLSGSLAACGAVTITNPFDLLKTRRQLHNELNISSPNGHIPSGRISAKAVYRVEGVRGLQTGLVAAYVYQILMNGTRFMVYEPTRRWLMGEQTFRQSPNLSNAAAGAIAGCLGAFVGSPLNLIKTRLQSFSPHFLTGHQHGYSGLREAIWSIAKRDGVAGFYHGVQASMLRTTTGSAVQLSSYEWFKARLANQSSSSDQFSTYLGAALGSGILASLAMNPFDVIMTRLYNQKAPIYRGILDCGVKTVKSEGIFALFKGLVPHFVRVGPHTVLTLVLLEQIRTFLTPVFYFKSASTAV